MLIGARSRERSSDKIMVLLFIGLFIILKFDSEDKEMGDVFHNVGREVGFDEVIATETASITIGIEPIRAIKDERNEFSFLDRRSEFK
jgi:hypothetical protein